MVIASNFNKSEVSKALLFFSLLICSCVVSAAVIQVTSDRNPVSLNESFQLVYESSDAVDDDPDFSPLEKYLDILNRSQSSNISFINGHYSSTKTWTLSVIARQVGDLVLPPVKFGSDQSASYKITVKASAKDQQAQSGFFTRISVDQEQVYAQQQLVITQQLFSDKNLSAYGLGELDFNGMDVISQPLGKEKQYKTRIGDRAYLVIERSYAVFPQTTGLMKIIPVLAEARTGSAASSFFDSFGRGKVLRARSNALEIAVLPVPDKINVNPWLPAREFQLLEQWPQTPPKFIQGEPVTRTLSIKAVGLTAAQLPVLPDISIEGLKQYPDKPLLNDIKNDTGITGYRLEKVALIPTKTGTITLPAIKIPWWNSATQQREVASIPARTINVQASTAIQPISKPQASIDQKINQQVLESPLINPVLPLHQFEDSESSTLWIILTSLFALGWLVTAVAWFISLKGKHKPAVNDLMPPASSLRHNFKQLKIACQKKEVAACRSQLLTWAQALFPAQNIHNMADVLKFLPAEMCAEISKINANLYGGQQQDIDFKLIIDQAALMMQDATKSRQPETDLLEPLYK